MKIYPSFRYQLRDQRIAILMYYAVLAGMILLSLIAMPFVSDEESHIVSTNGVTAITLVFAFVLSLCAFKESFLMNLQHGVSRRSQFIARLGAMGTVCAVLAVADEIYTLIIAGLSWIFPQIFMGNSLYEMLYCSSLSEDILTIQVNLTSILLSVVFSFFALLAVCSLGYLITVLMYRMNKLGKIIFWVSMPVLFIILSTYLGEHMDGWLMTSLINAFLMCFASLPRMMLTCSLLTVLFSGLSWLLMRRAMVK